MSLSRSEQDALRQLLVRYGPGELIEELACICDEITDEMMDRGGVNPASIAVWHDAGRTLHRSSLGLYE
jgi:hypothetical protein